MREKQLFTSESVTMGHPDKVADQISDAVLDAIIAQDKRARVACETLIKSGLCVVAGEVTTKADYDIPSIVRDTLAGIGYNEPASGFDVDNAAICAALTKQSPDISQGVTAGKGRYKKQGAGDQGLMFGFACNETPQLMPAAIMYAHQLVIRLAQVRKRRILPYLFPDGKSQVTVEYDGFKVKRIHTVVVSSHHSEGVKDKVLRDGIKEEVILKTLPKRFVDKRTRIFVNPTGRFVVGGPQGDCGLTGRKIIVDTYGGRGRHGGGAFSGKDPSKVDRSAHYYARYVAKNLVKAGVADELELQLAYAIGVAEPVSVAVDTFGTGRIPDDKIVGLVRKHFRLTPHEMITDLKLLRPIYRETARNGHFGRELKAFTWEKTDRAATIRKSAGL